MNTQTQTRINPPRIIDTTKRAFAFADGNQPGSRIVLVVYLEGGYVPTTLDNEQDSDDEARAVVARYNSYLDIPPHVAEAMKVGSMFGWECPAAQDAASYYGKR